MKNLITTLQPSQLRQLTNLYVRNCLLYALITAVIIIMLAGCGERTLNPSGAYGRIEAVSGGGTAQVLVKTDQSIGTAKRTIQEFLKWELANRGHVGADITKLADTMRDKAPQILQSAVRLRDTYAGAPTETNRNALDDSLRVLDATLAEVARYYKR